MKFVNSHSYLLLLLLLLTLGTASVAWAGAPVPAPLAGALGPLGWIAGAVAGIAYCGYRVIKYFRHKN